MVSNILNQFILATESVFFQVGNVSLQKKKVDFFDDGHKFTVNVATLVGFTGALKGQMVIAIKEEMAMKIASIFLMMKVNEYNEMGESSACEISNMIGGGALHRLQEIGYTCELSIPSLIRGQDVELGFTPKSPIFAVEFTSEWGPVLLIVRYDVNK